MIWVAAAAVAAGTAGVVMMVVCWSRPPASLQVLHEQLHSPRVAHATPITLVERPLMRRLVRWTVGASQARSADLVVTQRTADRHALDKLTYALVLAMLAVLPTVMLIVAAMAPPLVVQPLVLLGFAAGGYMLPELELRRQARKRRQAWRHTLSVYLDVVGISLAGGAGIEDAMLDAAAVGTGPEMRRLHSTLVDAQTRRDTTMWRELNELGTRADIEPLIELAASMDLAGDSGARIRGSLAAKAASLRTKELTELEAAEQRNSESLGVAPALMALAAVLLVGYPAVAAFVESS